MLTLSREGYKETRLGNVSKPLQAIFILSMVLLSITAAAQDRNNLHPRRVIYR
jgi:hypothetical protein